ncbi:hypothetical protein ACVWWP_008070 [Bradyrhizobium sp. LM3.6]
MSRLLLTVCALLGWLVTPAFAQQPQRSECLAMANAAPRVTPVAFRQAAASAEVQITYAGHSTYFIDTPGALAHRHRL